MIDIYRDPCQDTMVTPEKFGEVPQVAETYTYFNVAYPFMNEKGVLIGEHTWTGIDDVYNPEGMFVIANLEMLDVYKRQNMSRAKKPTTTVRANRVLTGPWRTN